MISVFKILIKHIIRHQTTKNQLGLEAHGSHRGFGVFFLVVQGVLELLEAFELRVLVFFSFFTKPLQRRS